VLCAAAAPPGSAPDAAPSVQAIATDMAAILLDPCALSIPQAVVCFHPFHAVPVAA
jgi:hypothetical protein